MAKHPLYDTAVSEVRGEASPAEKAVLASDVFAWRDALQSVIDEVDAQAVVKEDEFVDTTRGLSWDDDDYKLAQEQFEAWKSRVRTFKKHITARLMAVKRMCQEEADGGTSQATVVALAVKLRRAEAGSEEEWDAALDALLTAVDSYLDTN